MRLKHYQSAIRQEKLDALELIIERCSKKGLPTLKTELYAFALNRWGTEWRKFNEYLTDLLLLKIIVVDRNEIWTHKKWQKIESAREKDFNKMKEIINE